MYERHEREKYKMADLCDLFYTYISVSQAKLFLSFFFFWLVHVENENSGKYMRLRVNLWVPMYGRCWVGERCSIFYAIEKATRDINKKKR